MKVCNWCGKRVPKPWQKRYEHWFCNNECYQEWRKENEIGFRRSPDKTAFRKLKYLVDVRKSMR